MNYVRMSKNEFHALMSECFYLSSPKLLQRFATVNYFIETDFTLDFRTPVGPFEGIYNRIGEK